MGQTTNFPTSPLPASPRFPNPLGKHRPGCLNQANPNPAWKQSLPPPSSLDLWLEYPCQFFFFFYLEAAILENGNRAKKTSSLRTSLVAQWLRICLPMQGTRVQALVREDPTCRGATKPVRHNYWSLHVLEPVLRNKRSHCNEKPAHRNEE